MSPLETVTSENFVLYAARHFNDPQCSSIEEFYKELNRFKDLKKLVNRYLRGEEMGSPMLRMIMNHLIIIHNLFGIAAAKKMLVFKMETEQLRVLVPFFEFLGYTERMGGGDPLVREMIRKEHGS